MNGETRKENQHRTVPDHHTLFIPLIYKMKRVFRYEEGRTKTLLTPVPLTPRSPPGQGAATAETPSCPEDI